MAAEASTPGPAAVPVRNVAHRRPHLLGLITAMIVASAEFRAFVGRAENSEVPIEEHYWAAAETAATYLNGWSEQRLAGYEYHPIYEFITQTYG